MAGSERSRRSRNHKESRRKRPATASRMLVVVLLCTWCLLIFRLFLSSERIRKYQKKIKEGEGISTAVTSTPPSRPNILFILADDLGGIFLFIVFGKRSWYLFLTRIWRCSLAQLSCVRPHPEAPVGGGDHAGAALHAVRLQSVEGGTSHGLLSHKVRALTLFVSI